MCAKLVQNNVRLANIADAISNVRFGYYANGETKVVLFDYSGFEYVADAIPQLTEQTSQKEAILIIAKTLGSIL